MAAMGSFAVILAYFAWTVALGRLADIRPGQMSGFTDSGRW